MPLSRCVYFKAVPYVKNEVTLALESGVDGIIAPDEHVREVASLARCDVLAQSRVFLHTLTRKEDEVEAARSARACMSSRENEPSPDSDNPVKRSLAVLTRGWEIIPLENLLAQDLYLGAEAGNAEEARLAAEVLERGVPVLVLTKEALPEIKAIVGLFKEQPEKIVLTEAEITRIQPVGMGHRVCVDTASILHSGEGMLVGNSAAFTFLVNAETEHNEYVAARPFRINAGGVHAYCIMPGDKTAYLEELAAPREVLVVSHQGLGRRAIVGRVKTERRPMLLVEARIDAGRETPGGSVLLQNAETIRLVKPGGEPISVVALAPGDRILCRADAAGRHFGMRITEDITER
ncbi:3-dehydroquinate synthase II family protein [Desulfovibrio sp. OttesenSCG-928-G15]|nr:3-dehydroquinate synthase II family protein [Desulfovibrio sp. OttesenSCG-928-G15]